MAKKNNTPKFTDREEVDEVLARAFDELERVGLTFHVTDHDGCSMYVAAQFTTPNKIVVRKNLILRNEVDEPIESWRESIHHLLSFYDPIKEFRSYAKAHNISISKKSKETKQLLYNFYYIQRVIKLAQLAFASTTYPRKRGRKKKNAV